AILRILSEAEIRSGQAATTFAAMMVRLRSPLFRTVNRAWQEKLQSYSSAGYINIDILQTIRIINYI
ncbi:MAG: hypothetical protein ABI921_09330, partial [Panacibacter sp.]